MNIPYSPSMAMLGELHPVGGGDPVPLLKSILTVGRRESSDIVLRFPNVSGSHCELFVEDGYWHVKDLGSSNGTKVNGSRVSRQRLDPGDKLSIARHEYEILYEPSKLGASPQVLADDARNDPFSRSLLETAGLESRRPRTAPGDSSAPKPKGR